MLNEFAAIIPVGSAPEEPTRLRALLMSLLKHEPAVSPIILIDDAPFDRNFESDLKIPRSCEIIVLKNPRRGAGVGYLGGLFVGVMRGLKWIAERAALDFVIKLDTDSFVIRPFSHAVKQAISANRNIGQIGVIGRTCNRTRATFGYEKFNASPLIQICESWHTLSQTTAADNAPGHRVHAFNSVKMPFDVDVRSVIHIINRAVLGGYSHLAYCQGGAYAISPEMLRRVLKDPYLESYVHWAHIPVGEDVILGMYTHSLGMQLLDLSGYGQPFGLQSRGLPFDPNQLIERGYSIIHSLKSDPNHAEGELYSFFMNST